MREVLAFAALLLGAAGSMAVAVVVTAYQRGYEHGRADGYADSVRRLVRSSFELELDLDPSIVVVSRAGRN